MRTAFATAALLLVILLSGCVTSTTGSRTSVVAGKKGQQMTVRTTAYTHTEAGGPVNAVGGRLRFGGDTQSAAADWSWFPLGTRFRVIQTGRVYVVEDYGSALVGRKTLDLYMPSRKMMREWGVRQSEIEILEWGSHAMSLKLLETRQGNRHVREMVYALRKAQPHRDSRG